MSMADETHKRIEDHTYSDNFVSLSYASMATRLKAGRLLASQGGLLRSKIKRKKLFQRTMYIASRLYKFY